MVVKPWLLAGLFSVVSFCARASIPIPVDLRPEPDTTVQTAQAVTAPLEAPDGLRPCCAFGYNLKAQAFGIPVPFYQLGNVVEAEHLGEHQYNNSFMGVSAKLLGLSDETDGILYTGRGGFIDIAHVRDSADVTLWLFTHIWPQLGKAQSIILDEELAERRIVLSPFTPPSSPAARYTLAAWLSASLAFQLAAWHETAQWYGFESIPGFPEAVSAYSPEDLYSNLLGTRIAASLILSGHAKSLTLYNVAMTRALPDVLLRMGAETATETRFHFDMLDGQWWDSHKHVPEKFLVLKRNYTTGDNRVPTPVPGQPEASMHLQLPQSVAGYALAELGELQLWPGHAMQSLPEPPQGYYTWRDFPALADYARSEDAAQLAK
ncbi:DUF4056 domain-containing protein [Shimwellia blattae]|uniref:DUF4056 domain-containing protein n=1 Tax=Shimwellia blattae (strain ATCC 29907 / DSM 4481 / JCM 1650 / NBRC 105725 / CDC 9005-74) TaxID=630626 RepID=I2BD92_SHIBC|nr:DUF4056 domain-containing protein [Shimwellia blattae]AFJ48496.1 hypothetical protein EBL_c34400 [Shimwellia blattae DSM 4481 = NBRC 105725]VDY65989.1 Uncharacterised protein [Shimwellia blattae]VEC26550.1 Uncharacterised protein [Shimwellia blattae]